MINFSFGSLCIPTDFKDKFSGRVNSMKTEQPTHNKSEMFQAPIPLLVSCLVEIRLPGICHI
jgi:hypothetical protein